MAATLDAGTVSTRDGRSAGLGPVDLDVRMHDVYEEHHERLMGFFLRRIHDRTLAEDLTHDTIVRFAGAAERFDWERPVWPYLKATASNLLVDHTRRDQREVVVSVEADADWFQRPAPGQDIDDTVVLSALLQEALARLPDRQRVAIELRCRRGWDVTDAADFLGVPCSVFNQLLYRARENLRERLDQVGARVSGLVLPALVALRLRLREASDRLREVVPTPAASLSVEGLASMVIATTLGVAVAVGGPASGSDIRDASSGPVVGSQLVSHDVAVSTAPAPSSGGGAVIGEAPPVARSVDDESAAESSPDTRRTTVVQTPDAVPNSDGHVAAGNSEERFVISSEIGATTGLGQIHSDSEDLWVECSGPGEGLCDLSE